MRPDCVTLWIGDSLGPVERACLRSVLRQGHRLGLYCYRPPDGIPAGVELRDAREILPESAVFRHWTGSVASFSDWFRYELQRRGAGTWIDTDVYLVAPLDGNSPMLFGEQEAGEINNAVLRLPPDSPMIDALVKPFAGATPTWLPRRHRIASKAREWVNRKTGVAELPWGTTGPAALTAVARANGFEGCALPPEVLYPVPWQRAEWIRDPAIRLEDVTTARTVAVHLWNHCIGAFKNAPAPEGSFLDRLHREAS